MNFTDYRFASRTAADSKLSAALACRHPILEHIKRFEILFIKSSIWINLKPVLR
ncbi:hypothetical protein [uncultured Campylobacter sp.]|uniref:hypothetical protein n=1 Tax=uncultured Campylobacter sp. TaxID=218934 RepID=UPI00260AAC22|nr:hypothetical protein [uncultured Campylobacter sp.]